jgi:Tfp pilus assembly protein FimT
MTLVELLVTVSILMMLVVVALPAMTPSGESRRVREAVRQLNVFFSAARAQAMQTGRPAGVQFNRIPGMAQASITAYQVEVPPAYSGETLNATAQLSLASNNNVTAVFNVTATVDLTKLSVGDQMQFNNQGPLYTIASTTPLRVQLDVRDRRTWPWPAGGTPPAVPYKIYRQPILSAVTPLELPASVAIDLQSSGTDTYPTMFTATGSDLTTTNPPPTSVTFMFSPSGSLDRVYYNGTYRSIREPIYLLVGRQDRIQSTQSVTLATPENQQPNWFDPGSIWLTISPLTGIVAAKENFRVLAANGTYNNNNLSLARTYARQAETMGGR